MSRHVKLNRTLPLRRARPGAAEELRTRLAELGRRAEAEEQRARDYAGLLTASRDRAATLAQAIGDAVAALDRLELEGWR